MPTTPANLDHDASDERELRASGSGPSEPEEPASAWPELTAGDLSRALAGDRDALSDLFTCYNPSVRAAVAARIRHQPGLYDQFEDLVGDVWLSLCKNRLARLRYYDPHRGPFGYYIRMVSSQIVGHLLAARGRRAATLEHAHEPDEDVSFEPWLLDRDLWQRLWQRIEAELPQRDIDLFVDVVMHGRPIRELVPDSGKTEKALYQHISRMKQKIIGFGRELADHREGELQPGTRREGAPKAARRHPAVTLTVCKEQEDEGVDPDGTR